MLEASGYRGDVVTNLRTQNLPADEIARRPARHQRAWATVTAVEVAAGSAAVALDLVIPTLVLLAMAGVSLLIRRQGFGSLGFHRVEPRRLAVKMLVFAAAWSLLQHSVGTSALLRA
jgi:hypothetical protein